MFLSPRIHSKRARFPNAYGGPLIQDQVRLARGGRGSTNENFRAAALFETRRGESDLTSRASSRYEGGRPLVGWPESPPCCRSPAAIRAWRQRRQSNNREV